SALPTNRSCPHCSLQILLSRARPSEAGEPPGYTRTLHQPGGLPKSLHRRCKLNSGGSVRKGCDGTHTGRTRYAYAYATDTRGRTTPSEGPGVAHGTVNCG